MKFQSVYVALALTAVSGKVYFEEQFNDGSLDHWTVSKARDDYGELKLSSGRFFADEKENQGLQTTQDARFYATSSKFETPFNNSDKPLVLQFSAKNEQDIDCGGGYIKVLPEMDQLKFDGDTKYNLMFGPDVCGSDRKVHAIINHNDKNFLTKRYINVPNDILTHVYTWIIHPDKTYEILVDNEQKVNGTLYEDWDILPAKEIDDPEDKKPEDWVEEEFIADPEDKKPEDWYEGPATIPDPEAVKPEDWNDEDDGDWEVPTIANPEYKGEWSAKEIKNPAYKGDWEPRKIANPEYKEDNTIGQFESSYVGFDLWQVKSGTIFDNILVTDDVEYAKEFSDKHFTAFKDAELQAKEAEDKVKEEEEKKKEEAEKLKEEEEEASRKAEEAADETEVEDKPEEAEEASDDVEKDEL